MARTFLLALISLSWTVIVLAKLGPPGGPQKLTHDTADAVKVFQSFPYVVSVTDSDNDTIFECMEANRTEFDPVAKTATFVWILRAPGSPDRVEVPLPQKAGQEPGTVEFLDPIDQTPREAKIYYTDYETCAILDFEVYGHQCALWVRRDVTNSLSKECIDQFEDTCGVVVPENRRIHCGDDSTEN
uniref:Lipocalin n=1 Tax=Rhipicephalus appendiculatus TaxID=34631 RepID=A0A131YG24_RHIAP